MLALNVSILSGTVHSLQELLAKSMSKETPSAAWQTDSLPPNVVKFLRKVEFREYFNHKN